jgi:hypothetical protein
MADQVGLERALMALSSLILVGFLCSTHIAARPGEVVAAA